VRKRLPLAIAAAAALLLPAAPALAAPTVDTTPPQVRSVEVAQSAVTVSGLQTVLVTVRVRLTDDTGVEVVSSPGIGYWPVVSFAPTLSAYALLALTEGTPQDGIWTGQVAVTSAWKGTVQANRVAAYDAGAMNLLDVDPRTVVDTASIVVTSTHTPAVDMTFSPEPATKGQPVTQRVRAWDTDTGRPWANLPMTIGNDNGCVEPGFRLNVHTDAAGNYQRTVPADQAEALHCVWVPGQPGSQAPGWENRTIIAIDSQFVRYQKFSVGAVPAAASVPAGTNVNVNGNVTPVKPNKVLQLQRYSGGRWKTVNTGRVRTSGRYTIVATPPGKATYSYRVYAPGDAETVGGISKVFTIRGT
jgi:hypothetical protein